MKGNVRCAFVQNSQEVFGRDAQKQKEKRRASGRVRASEQLIIKDC